jgi:hypothetical protein
MRERPLNLIQLILAEEMGQFLNIRPLVLPWIEVFLF